MNLRSYVIEMQYKTALAGKKARQAQIALKLSISQSMLSALQNGSKKPSLEMMKQIQKATRGAVSLSDWN